LDDLDHMVAIRSLIVSINHHEAIF
jgi:hypothetical protein